MKRRAYLVAAAVIAGAAVAACKTDPVYDDALAALPPEDSQVPQGEYHRAGQDCLLCHQAGGPAKSHFAVAGTIFASRARAAGMPNANVLLVDVNGSTITTQTNCVGNFWVVLGNDDNEWTPRFPVLVNVNSGATTQIMTSEININGSCNACHQQNQTVSSPGWVYVSAGTPSGGYPTGQGCPAPNELNVPAGGGYH